MTTSERGLVLTVKQVMPERLWRMITRPTALLLRAGPDTMKYEIGLKVRRDCAPYQHLADDDRGHTFERSNG